MAQKEEKSTKDSADRRLARRIISQLSNFLDMRNHKAVCAEKDYNVCVGEPPTRS
jgi:hypothetical protein